MGRIAEFLLNPMIREERTEGGGGTYISQLEINQNSWETLGDPVETTLGDDQLVLSIQNVTRILLWVYSESPSLKLCPILSSCCPTVLCLFLESILSLACRKERAEFDWREGRSTRNNYLNQYRSLRAEKDKENKLVKWGNILWIGQKRIKSGGCENVGKRRRGLKECYGYNLHLPFMYF